MTIKRARELLSRRGGKLTDLQIQEAINTLTVLSDLAIDHYLKKRIDENRKTNQ